MTQDIWSYCLSRLESELPPQQFNTWIKALSPEIVEDGGAVGLRLCAPSRFVLQWVRDPI